MEEKKKVGGGLAIVPRGTNPYNLVLNWCSPDRALIPTAERSDMPPFFRATEEPVQAFSPDPPPGAPDAARLIPRSRGRLQGSTDSDGGCSGKVHPTTVIRRGCSGQKPSDAGGVRGR